MNKTYKKSELNITNDNALFYKNFLEFKTKELVLGKVLFEDSETIKIEFDIDEKLLKLKDAKVLTNHEKYRLVLAIIVSLENLNENIDVDLSDNNILFDELFQVKFIERKFIRDKKDKLEAVLRVLSYLFIDEAFDQIYQMDRTILNKSKFTKIFKDVQTMEDMKELLTEQIDVTVHSYYEDEIAISKKQYRKLKTFKKRNKFIYGVLVIIIVYACVFRIPLMKKELNITAFYEQQEYSKVVNESKHLNPKFMKNNIKYYVGVATIKTEDLSDTQKENILVNFSMNVDEDTLDYWVYISQGEYEKAKLKAQNIGDLDLQEYALVKQLEMLEVQNLKDEEENELRTQYNSEIDSIESQKAELQGSVDEDSAI